MRRVWKSITSCFCLTICVVVYPYQYTLLQSWCHLSKKDKWIIILLVIVMFVAVSIAHSPLSSPLVDSFLSFAHQWPLNALMAVQPPHSLLFKLVFFFLVAVAVAIIIIKLTEIIRWLVEVSEMVVMIITIFIITAVFILVVNEGETRKRQGFLWRSRWLFLKVKARWEFWKNGHYGKRWMVKVAKQRSYFMGTRQLSLYYFGTVFLQESDGMTMQQRKVHGKCKKAEIWRPSLIMWWLSLFIDIPQISYQPLQSVVPHPWCLTYHRNGDNQHIK